MAVLLVSLVCGGCGRRFEANAYSVPHFRGHPACRTCWDQLNQLRVQANMKPWECPEDAYPPPLGAVES